MKKYMLFMTCILIACTVRSQKNMDSYLEIDFQDFFKNDTVSLTINQYLIFKNKPLISDFSTGITDVRVRIYHYEGGGLIKFDNDSLKIDSLSNPVIIKASLNGSLNEYTIKLENGKYIGLSKKSDTGFKLYQSKKPFEYD